jgi:hypothetical protein
VLDEYQLMALLENPASIGGTLADPVESEGEQGSLVL